jgi:hypothetical protein
LFAKKNKTNDNPSRTVEGFFMFKKSYVIIGLAVAIILIGAASYFFLRFNPPQNADTVSSQGQVERVFYQGRDGVDALTLLSEVATVEEQNGFVSSVNGRKAEEKNKEYWAFYLNGSLAQIGAKEYITKDTDQIVWKIENY